MKNIAVIWLIGCLVPTASLRSLQADSPVVVLQGERATELAPHKLGNVYAPEIHRQGKELWMWYGGQGQDGHDRIHLAKSTDGTTWQKLGVVLDNEKANHVNDPSVVRVGDLWWMFYTIAERAEQDEIAAATSQDGQRWKTHGVVLTTGQGNTWDSGKVGRPSVLYQDGKFHMWYDGQPSTSAAESGDELCRSIRSEGRATGYAQSDDGLSWERRPTPVFRHGSGAVHVTKTRQDYLLVYESGQGTRWASSNDLFDWQDRGVLLSQSRLPTDAYGHVTPFLFIDEGIATLYFGAAARKTWDGNSIACTKIKLP